MEVCTNMFISIAIHLYKNILKSGDIRARSRQGSAAKSPSSSATWATATGWKIRLMTLVLHHKIYTILPECLGLWYRTPRRVDSINSGASGRDPWCLMASLWALVMGLFYGIWYIMGKDSRLGVHWLPRYL